MTTITRYLLPAALGLLGATGCNPDPEPEPPEPEPLPWPEDRTPYTIDTLGDDGAPTGARVAYLDGATWRAAAEPTPGIFTFTPTATAVAYAVGCPPAPGASFQQARIRIDLTTLDRHRVVDGACRSYSSTRTYVPFSMAVAPADAMVTVSNGWRLWGEDATAFEAVPGRSDIVALSADRILIRRDVALPPPAPLVLDVDRDGVALERVALTLPAVRPDELVTAELTLSTAGGAYLSWWRDPAAPGEALAVPAGILREGDRQSVRFAATLGSLSRSVQVPLADAASARLPAPYGEVTASWQPAAHVTWKGRPASAEGMSLGASQNVGDTWLDIAAYATPAWLAATGQAVDGTWTIPDFAQVEGWPSTWRLDPAATDTPSLSLSEMTFSDDFTSWSSISWYGGLDE